MALLTPLAFDDARRLGAEVGLDVQASIPLALGSVNSNFSLTTRDGQRYFARIYEEQGRAGAEAEVELVGALALAGVPVVQSLKRRDGELVGEVLGKPFAIFPWLDGEILCTRRVNVRACHLLGGALAGVHSTTPAIATQGEGRFRIADLRERLTRALVAGRPELEADIAFIHERLTRYELARDGLAAPRGVIHSDLFRDNVLWQGENLLALLDFESACTGAFAYDLMVTICAWCYGDAFEPSLVEALVRGYHEVRPLEQGDREALLVEGAVGCLRFATTRITDFSLRAASGERPARDYRRFLERLRALEGGALDATFRRALA